MFAPSDASLPLSMGGSRQTGSTRSNAQPTKWDYVKTFYYDPVTWNFVKSVAFLGVAIYIIRDLASNDLLPMD